MLILAQTKTGDTICFEIQSEKRHVFLTVNRRIGYINVLVDNAQHRAWRGMGRTFWSFDDARNAYKSGDVKAMISMVEETSATA